MCLEKTFLIINVIFATLVNTTALKDGKKSRRALVYIYPKSEFLVAVSHLVRIPEYPVHIPDIVI